MNYRRPEQHSHCVKTEIIQREAKQHRNGHDCVELCAPSLDRRPLSHGKLLLAPPHKRMIPRLSRARRRRTLTIGLHGLPPDVRTFPDTVTIPGLRK
jgi:hypothetical protein